MTKTCFKCERELPVDEFYRHPQMKDGRLGKCKSCTRTDVNANRTARITYYRAYDKERDMQESRNEARKRYQKTPSGRVAHARAVTSWAISNPKKRAAHRVVTLAKRSGDIAPKPCEVCGAENTHGHHDRYSEPLKLHWLCPKHHVEAHKAAVRCGECGERTTHPSKFCSDACHDAWKYGPSTDVQIYTKEPTWQLEK